MKLKSILFILLTVLVWNSYLYAENGNGGYTFPIETNEDPAILPIRRTPSRTPIIGVYSNGYIELVFRDNLGMVDFIVENTETLETWTASFDSEAGYFQIEVSDHPGRYTVFLNTEVGIFRSSYVVN